MTARYYMKYTGCDQDTVERNTSRDFFMTPEDAVIEGEPRHQGRCEGEHRAGGAVLETGSCVPCWRRKVGGWGLTWAETGALACCRVRQV